jgi:phosphohistidine phosphatase
MRHSKAEQTGDSDMGRTLTERGHRDAADAGRWLARRGFTPDHALVSSAARTRETWSSLAVAAGWSLEVEPDSALYSAGPESALDVLRSVPVEARSLIVVGHNPTMAFLAQMLDDGGGDDEAAAQMVAGFPTSAVAVFDVAVDWAGLDMGTSSLRGFHVGRGADA